MTTVKKWMEKEGENILRDIGIKSGQTVLDFGCGSGNYTILASRIVGSAGKIFALDSDEVGLSELLNKIKKDNIKNIEFITTSGEIEFPLPDEMIHVVLMYDVLHLLDDNERNKLFREAHRVLKKNGFVSYHATHLGSKYDVNLEEIHEKMKINGFRLDKDFKKPMFHWEWIEDSIIFNYYKKI